MFKRIFNPFNSTQSLEQSLQATEKCMNDLVEFIEKLNVIYHDISSVIDDINSDPTEENLKHLDKATKIKKKIQGFSVTISPLIKTIDSKINEHRNPDQA